MLEIKLKDGCVERMVATGNTLDLVAEVGVVVSTIHNAMRQSAPGSAELFRVGIQSVFSDGNSPVCTEWTVDAAGISEQVLKPGKEGG